MATPNGTRWPPSAGGRQELGANTLTYGQSITEACLAFVDTKRAIEALAMRLR